MVVIAKALLLMYNAYQRRVICIQNHVLSHQKLEAGCKAGDSRHLLRNRGNYSR